MKFYKIFLTSLTIVISCCLICPVFADWVSGGVWSYGANHDPNNWGAFSNYYHDYKYHWSSVSRARNSKSSYAYAPSHQTSRAFINTNFGETAYFNYGF